MGFWNRLFGGQGHDTAYRELADKAMAELRLRTQAMDNVFRLGVADWNVDQEAGTLIFTAPDGVVATCSVQMIGTYNTEDGTWLWGWDHPSVADGLDRAAAAVRDWGTAHGNARLTKREVSCEEAECWEFAAIACHLTGAQGAYSGPAGPTLVFMTFDDVNLSKPDPTRPGARSTHPLADLPMDGPSAAGKTVHGFLTERYKWERDAFEADGPGQGDFAKRTYRELIERYCAHTVVPQGVAYGSHPSFGPGTFDIVGETVDGERCVVVVASDGMVRPRSERHEFHLRGVGDRWLISSMLYVGRDDRYESL